MPKAKAKPQPKASLPYESNPFAVFINSFKVLNINLKTLLWLYLAMFVIFVPLILLLASAAGISAASGEGAKITFSAGAVVMLLLTIMLATILQAAYLSYGINTARGREISFRQVVQIGLDRTLPLIGLFLLGGLLITVGLILLIIPGLIFAYWLIFAPYLMVDQRLGVVEAMKRSRQLVRGKVVEIGGLAGASFIFTLPSLVPFVGNLYQLVYTPVSQIAWAYRYNSAQELAKSGRPKPANDPANYWGIAVLAVFPLIILAIAIALLSGARLYI